MYHSCGQDENESIVSIQTEASIYLVAHLGLGNTNLAGSTKSSSLLRTHKSHPVVEQLPRLIVVDL